MHIPYTIKTEPTTGERIRKWHEEHPFKIPTIFRIPNIKKQYPSILEALCSNSLKEDVQDD